jgi:hypothetical protein
LLDDAAIVFPTRDGRIVFERTRAYGEHTPLSVMLPDESIVELEARIVGAFYAYPYGGDWPVDRDEVVYIAEQAGRWQVRRTVLP